MFPLVPNFQFEDTFGESTVGLIFAEEKAE